MLTEAARFNCDQIEHSMAWLGSLLIAIAVAVVVAVAIVATGGLAAIVAAGVTWAGAGLAASALGTVLGAFGFAKTAGDMLGAKKIFEGWKSDAGPIKEHSPDTTIEGKWAARTFDKVDCHSGKRVATGCKTIFINTKPATRKDEKTECAGKIKTGAGSVFYGGPSEEYLPVDKEEAIPDWLWWTYEVIDWAGFLLGIPGMVKGLANFSFKALMNPKAFWEFKDAAMAIYDTADKFVTVGTKWAEGTFADYYAKWTDTPAPTSGFWAKQDWTDSSAYKWAKFAWSGIGFASGTADFFKPKGGGSSPGTTATPEPASTQAGPGGGPPAAAHLPGEAPRANGPGTPGALPGPAARPEGAPGPVPASVPGDAPRLQPSGDPPHWDATVAAMKAEREGRVELPEWHERMVGSRGE